MIIHSDARFLPLKDRSVHCCVTSPPYYGLRDYGVHGQIGLEPTPDAYVAEIVAVFREVRRVLKDDGTLWLNLGDSYARTGGTDRQPSKTARVGNTRRSNKQIPDRQQVAPVGHKEKDLIGIPWMVAFALRADGWYLRSDIIWAKPNPMPESVTDRPTKAHEYLFLLAKSARYYYDSKAIKEPATGQSSGNGFVRPHRLSIGGRGNAEPWKASSTGKRNKRSVWVIPPKPYRGAHFATFPPALVEPCILAGCPVGGIVLDPFFGSGTVGEVAQAHGRRWIGCELNPHYHPLSKARTSSANTPISCATQLPYPTPLVPGVII